MPTGRRRSLHAEGAHGIDRGSAAVRHLPQEVADLVAQLSRHSKPTITCLYGAETAIRKRQRRLRHERGIDGDGNCDSQPASLEGSRQ